MTGYLPERKKMREREQIEKKRKKQKEKERKIKKNKIKETNTYHLGKNKSPSKTVLLFITVISCTKFNFCVGMIS